MVRPMQTVQISKLPLVVSERLLLGESVPVTDQGDQVAIIQPTHPAQADLAAFLVRWREEAPELSEDPFGDVASLRHGVPV